MSSEERDRLVVIRAVVAKKMTQKEAADKLDLSARQVRRILRAYEAEGDAALVHGLRGKPSNNRYSEQFKAKVMELVMEHYRDFGPTLACEKLAEHHDLHLSRETLRKWMMEYGVWQGKKQKPKHRMRRPRKECIGELVQFDGSAHDWFELGHGARPVLLMAIDDATGHVWGRFAPTEGTETVMAALRDYMLLFGRPKAIYADRASHFITTRDATVEEQLKGLDSETQIQRALRQLQVEYIPAGSPQAKGRIERSFGTHQDRLVKELRLRDIKDIEAANQFLEDWYLDDHNDRFAVQPKLKLNLHRQIDGFDLDAIFSRQYTRVVRNDYTIQLENVGYQIAKDSVTGGLRGGKVIVEQRLDGSVHVRFKDQYLNVRALPPEQPKARNAADSNKHARKRRRTGTAVTPADDHPWKRRYKVAGSG